MLELGKKAKDKVTGFEGILTGHCKYLYGCDQYLITPPVDKNGSKPDGQWLDSGRIEITGEGINAEEVQADEAGGENNDSPSCRW